MIALIPASSKSKSVKDKNIYPFGGHPMIAWSVVCARMSKYIKKVYVFTDSEQYGEIALKYGADEIVYNRDPNIGMVSDVVYIRQFLDLIGDTDIPKIVLLRPTTPLRDPDVVDAAIEQFTCASRSSLRSVTKMSESAYKCMEMIGGMLYPIGDHTIPRQLVPETYHPNGYVDILYSYTIRNGNGWGTSIMPFVTEDVGELDSPEDIDYIEWKLSQGKGGKILERLRNSGDP